jgi:hypothetical protein
MIPRATGLDHGTRLKRPGYDWRKVEARLNALPQFVTTIDGLDIQFVHIRSRDPNALPMIMTHGWPGSIIELMKVSGPLTDPTAHGGSAGDARGMRSISFCLRCLAMTSRANAAWEQPERFSIEMRVAFSSLR